MPKNTQTTFLQTLTDARAVSRKSLAIAGAALVVSLLPFNVDAAGHPHLAMAWADHGGQGGGHDGHGGDGNNGNGGGPGRDGGHEAGHEAGDDNGHDADANAAGNDDGIDHDLNDNHANLATEDQPQHHVNEVAAGDDPTHHDLIDHDAGDDRIAP